MPTTFEEDKMFMHLYANTGILQNKVGKMEW